MKTRFRPTLWQYRDLEDSFKEQVRINNSLKAKLSAAEEAFIRENTERRRLEQQLLHEIDMGGERTIRLTKEREFARGWAIFLFAVALAGWGVVVW